MKIRYLGDSLFNIIRLGVKSIWYHGKIKYTPVQLLSVKTDIEIDRKSSIVFGGRLVTEKGVLLSSKNNGTLVFGDKCYLNRNVMVVCRDKITVGCGTTIGPNVVIYDHDHDISNRGQIKTKPIIIGKNVWIGANCTILKGIKIGDNSVIAAGTIITKDIESNVIAYEEKKILKKQITRIITSKNEER